MKGTRPKRKKPEDCVIGEYVTSLQSGAHGQVIARADAGVWIDPSPRRPVPLCVRAEFIYLP